MPPNQRPKDIHADTQAQQLVITWPDGHVDRHGFVALRAQCGCAHCVDEMTGERLITEADIPADISITNMQLTGNYALRITWSDGHDTGLYSWQRLVEIAAEQ